MSNLSENQLKDLSTIIYLDILGNEKNRTVGDFIQAVLDDPSLLDNSKNEGKYPNGMSKTEWLNYLQVLSQDTTLMNLEISPKATEGIGSEGKSIDRASGERMALFVDPNTKDAYLVFRGTVKAEEWMDNGHTLEKTLSDHQKNALDDVANIDLSKYASVTATGHSKGGNKAQLIALLNEHVNGAVVFNAPGFSYDFTQVYKEEIKRNKNKLLQIASERDYVNCLGYQLAGQRILLDTPHESNPMNYHYTSSMMDTNFGLLGEEFYLQEPCATSQYITELTTFTSRYMQGEERSEMLAGLMVQFDTKLDKSEKIDHLMKAILEASQVIGLDNLTKLRDVPIHDLLMDYYGDDFLADYDIALDMTNSKEITKVVLNIVPGPVIIEELIKQVPESWLDNINRFVVRGTTHAVMRLADEIGNTIIAATALIAYRIDFHHLINEIVNALVEIVASAIKWCAETGKEILKAMKEAFDLSINWLGDQVDALVNTLEDVKNHVVEFGKNTVDGLVEYGEQVFDSTVELIEVTSEEFSGWWSETFSSQGNYQNPHVRGRSNNQGQSLRGGRRGRLTTNVQTESVARTNKHSEIIEKIKIALRELKENISSTVMPLWESIEVQSFIDASSKNVGIASTGYASDQGTQAVLIAELEAMIRSLNSSNEALTSPVEYISTNTENLLTNIGASYSERAVQRALETVRTTLRYLKQDTNTLSEEYKSMSKSLTKAVGIYESTESKNKALIKGMT
jgi:hypothetical protein